MTTEDKITVTADGVTYERGGELDAIPLDGSPFFEGEELHRRSNTDWVWLNNIDPLLASWEETELHCDHVYYAAIPKQPKAPEWVEVAVDHSLLMGPALQKAVSHCLKAQAVKIEWQSGTKEYWNRDGWNLSGLVKLETAFEQDLVTAFLAGYRVWVKEGQA